MAQEKTFLEILASKIERRLREESPLKQAENCDTRENFRIQNLNMSSWISQIPLGKYEFAPIKGSLLRSAYLKNQAANVAKSSESTMKPKETAIEIPRLKHVLSEEQSVAFAYFLNWKSGLRQDYTAVELKKIFRKLALQLHPDRNLGASRFYLELKKNYELLNSVFTAQPF